MLHELHSELTARGIALRIVGAHGWVRDLLRADGLQAKVGELPRAVTLDSLLAGTERNEMQPFTAGAQTIPARLTWG